MNMEDIFILRSVLQDYIKKQSDIDKRILNLFIQDDFKEYEIANITGYSISKINRVIRRLRGYLRKLNYSWM